MNRLILSLLLLLLGASLAQSNGASLYNASCLACHQATGLGIPPAFPPLANHSPSFMIVEGGRSYLINVILYGLNGSMEIDSQSYNGVMPAWSQLSDDDIAAVLNYILTAWDNETLLAEDFVPIGPEEVKAARAESLSPVEVHALRESLTLP